MRGSRDMKLGFTINTNKSVFEPSQKIDLLRFTVDCRRVFLLLHPEKVEKTRSLVGT